MPKKDWDVYFLELALHVASRATCDRLHVGCLLVREHDIIATGYNGSLSGMPHCDDVGHDMDEGHCVRTVHAEQNAICMAARNGHSTRDATAYVTHHPCWLCFKLLVQAGIKRIVCGSRYRVDPRITQAAVQLGVAVLHPQALSQCPHCNKLHFQGKHRICKACQEEARQEGLCTLCCGTGRDLSYEHERDSRDCPLCGGHGLAPE